MVNDDYIKSLIEWQEHIAKQLNNITYWQDDMFASKEEREDREKLRIRSSKINKIKSKING